MRVLAYASMALLVAACATQEVVETDEAIHATPAQIEAGRQFAEDQCGTCHAVSTADRSPVRDAPPFRYLGERYPVSSLAESLAEGMMTGHLEMPEWELAPEEITSLLGYIQSIQRKD